MGEHKLPPKQTGGFLRQFLRQPPGVPTKQRFEPPPPKEVMPNYVRLAMGLWGRRVILSPETQIMLKMVALREEANKTFGRERTDHTISTMTGKPIVLDSYAPFDLHEHQRRALDSLREVNSTVTIVLPENVGKGAPPKQE